MKKLLATTIALIASVALISNKRAYLLKTIQIMLLVAVAFMGTSGRVASQAITIPFRSGSIRYLPFFPGPSDLEAALFIGNDVGGQNNGLVQFIRTDGGQAAPSTNFSVSTHNVVHLAISYDQFNDSPLYSSAISTDGPANPLIYWAGDTDSLPGMYRAISSPVETLFLGPILKRDAMASLWVQNASNISVNMVVDFLGLDGVVASQVLLNSVIPNASLRVDEIDDLPNSFIGWARVRVTTVGGQVVLTPITWTHT